MATDPNVPIPSQADYLGADGKPTTVHRDMVTLEDIDEKSSFAVRLVYRDENGKHV